MPTNINLPVEEVAMQKLQAAILSDGGLRCQGGNACFYIALSDNKDNLIQRERIPIGDLLAFLQRFVEEALKPLGIEPLQGHPRVEPHITKSKNGEGLPGVLLWTRTSELNTGLHHECYPNGKKVIPESFVLTDVFLAWFFMFDGNSQWSSSGGSGINVSLFTQSYDFHSIELFEKQLHHLGISTGRKHDKRIKDGPGIIITILRDSTDYFMKRIDPHVVFPYRYKIKYKGSCPPELAEKYRGSNNEHVREWRRGKKERKQQEAFNKLRKELARGGTIKCPQTA